MNREKGTQRASARVTLEPERPALSWLLHLPDAGSITGEVKAEIFMLEKREDALRRLAEIDRELANLRAEAVAAAAKEWTDEEIEAAKAAAGQTKDPDEDLVRMCRSLGNGAGLNERETALLRHFGLATKHGEFRLTSKGVRMAERGL